MKKKIALACVLLIVLAAGCNNIQQLQEGVVAAQEGIDLLDESIANLRVELEANLDLTDAQKAAITERLDETVAVKAMADDLLASFQNQLEAAKEGGLGAQVEAGGNFMQRLASVLPPPLNGYGALIGIILTSVGGTYAKRQKTLKTQTESALKDVVKGVDELLSNGIVTDVKMAKKTLAGFQDKLTMVAVRKIKNGG